MAPPDADMLHPMADLAGRWGVTSNTVSRRLSFLGIKPIRQGNFRFITSEQLALAEDLHQHVLAGKPMEWFPRPEGAAEEPAGRVVRQAPAAQPEALAGDAAAAMVALLQAAAAPVDPLRRARGLAEASDAGLVLANDDLAALLGQGVSGWENGTERFGYRFIRHRQGKQVLWTVERAITTDRANDSGPRALPGGTSRMTRPVGFAALVEPAVVEAETTVLARRVELPPVIRSAPFALF